MDKCFKYIEENSLNDRVQYISSIQQKYLRFIYENVFLTALPSINEIFGMVILESMYFGTPVITSVNGGSVTILENKVNGIVMDNFKAESWYGEILKLVNEEEIRNNMGAEARNKVVNYYGWGKITEKFIKNYFQCKE